MAEGSPWRVLDVSGSTCAENMGRMAVVCASILSGTHDRVLVIGTFGTTHFNVGWFDDVDEVVDVAACRREGVELVRRPVYGGGTAYYDADAVMFVSQLVRAEEFAGLDAALEAWQPVVTDALDRLGLGEAGFEGSSDVRWHGRKLGSFMANAVLGCIAVGGYLNLRRPDLDLYARCAKVPAAKFADKATDDPIHYIVTPEEIRAGGSAVAFTDAKVAFCAALEAHTPHRCREVPLDPAERAGTAALAQQMASEENLLRVSSARFRATAPAGSRVGFGFHKARKLIRVGIAVDAAAVIVAAMVAGDMFVSPPDAMDDCAAALVGVHAADGAAVAAALAAVLARPDVVQADAHLGIDAGDLAAAVAIAFADTATPAAADAPADRA
ncbi:MAG: hypothetical protein U0U69_11645 [Acidimicrobiia bacterium]